MLLEQLEQIKTEVHTPRFFSKPRQASYGTHESVATCHRKYFNYSRAGAADGAQGAEDSGLVPAPPTGPAQPSPQRPAGTAKLENYLQGRCQSSSHPETIAPTVSQPGRGQRLTRTCMGLSPAVPTFRCGRVGRLAQPAFYAPSLPHALCNRSLDPDQWLLSSLAFGPNYDFRGAQGCCQGLKAFRAVESSVYGKGLNQPGQAGTALRTPIKPRAHDRRPLALPGPACRPPDP